MPTGILYCKTCRSYTLDSVCTRCGGKTVSKKPARFSLQDYYGKYRRRLKQLEKNVV